MLPRKAEVWDLADEQGNMIRMLVVSGIEWNASVMPQAAPLSRRHQHPEVLPFAVALHEADPVGNAIVLMDLLGPVDPGSFVERIGTLVGVTMAKVDACMKYIYEID